MQLTIPKWHSPVSCCAISHIPDHFWKTFDQDLFITDIFSLFTLKLNISGWICIEILDLIGNLCYTRYTYLKIFKTHILYVCKTFIWNIQIHIWTPFNIQIILENAHIEGHKYMRKCIVNITASGRDDLCHCGHDVYSLPCTARLVYIITYAYLL